MRDAVQIIMTLTAIFVMLIIMVIAIEIRINTKATMHHHEATVEHIEKIKE